MASVSDYSGSLKIEVNKSGSDGVNVYVYISTNGTTYNQTGNAYISVTCDGQTKGSYTSFGKNSNDLCIFAEYFSVSRDGYAKTVTAAASLDAGSVWGLPTYVEDSVYFDAYTYSVSYNANGGSGAPDGQIQTHGVPLGLSYTKPTRTGFTFQGWATYNGGAVAYQPGWAYSANTSVTLYAVWIRNKLTISYDANGGSDAPLDQVKEYGIDLSLTADKPTQTGFTFLSWNTVRDGTGIEYLPEAVYTDDSQLGTYDASTVLYAQWSRDSYAITFDANGGDENSIPESVLKYYDVPLVLPDIVPTRNKYVFLGWSDDAAGIALYSAGGAYPSNLNEPSTLYAIWKLDYITPTISNLKACRSTDDFVDDEKGLYIHLTGKWNVDNIIHADNVADNLLIEYKSSDSDEWIEAVNYNPAVAEDTINVVIGNGTILHNESYHIRVTVTDWGGSKSSQVVLPQQFRTFDVGNKGKSFAIGQPANDELEGFDISMDVRLHADTKFATGIENTIGNIPMKPIHAGEDLNDYKTVGFYYSDYSDSYPDGIANAPEAFQEISFALEVFYGGGYGELIQRATRCHKNEQMVCQRMFYSDSWSEWTTISMNGQKVLWEHSRGVYMNADQTAKLREPISYQENGIVFVFSAFNEEDATPLDYQWQFKFIPKYFAVQSYDTPSANKGVSVALSAKSFEYIATKYLYVYDDHIDGDETNGLNGTADCGIKYTNTHWVLRYILGC